MVTKIFIGIVITVTSLLGLKLYTPLFHEQIKESKFKKYDVTIYRDTWGVPHIFGEKDRDTAYGLAYAHAEDDFKTIQDLLLGARAKLGSVYGIKYTPVDYYVGLIGVWNQVNNRYEKEIPKENYFLEKL